MIVPAQFAWGEINGEDRLVMRDSANAITEPEPKIQFADKNGVLLTIKSTGVEYNRTERPHDSYRQAAENFFNFIQERLIPVGGTVSHTSPIYDIGLKAWRQYEAKKFEVCRTGITHNFELDNWHWWMIDHLQTLLRTKFK